MGLFKFLMGEEPSIFEKAAFLIKTGGDRGAYGEYLTKYKIYVRQHRFQRISQGVVQFIPSTQKRYHGNRYPFNPREGYLCTGKQELFWLDIRKRKASTMDTITRQDEEGTILQPDHAEPYSHTSVVQAIGDRQNSNPVVHCFFGTLRAKEDPRGHRGIHHTKTQQVD